MESRQSECEVMRIRGVVTYKGKLVENLHVVMAEKIVQQHELIEKMKGN